MDRYFNKHEHKIYYDFTKLGQAVCVLGKTGIGKTWAVNNALRPAVHITPEILRSHQGTIDFLNKIHGTSLNVILDEYECVKELAGMSEIKKIPTNGLFVVISQIPVKFNFEIVTWEFPVYTPEEMRKIAPGVTDAIIKEARGDVRFILRSLEFNGDIPDLFQDTKEFITNLVSKKSTFNPVQLLGHSVQEPGNVASILHENYVDSDNIKYDKIMEHFSLADIFETRVYNGEWNLFAYYSLFGCVLPAVEIGHSLEKPIRPGSTWTKHQNMCMRAKRIAAMSRRVPNVKLSNNELLLLRDYAEQGNIDILKEYSITPSDLDVMNHLSPLRKVKPKVLSTLKKSLS